MGGGLGEFLPPIPGTQRRQAGEAPSTAGLGGHTGFWGAVSGGEQVAPSAAGQGCSGHLAPRSHTPSVLYVWCLPRCPAQRHPVSLPTPQPPLPFPTAAVSPGPRPVLCALPTRPRAAPPRPHALWEGVRTKDFSPRQQRCFGRGVDGARRKEVALVISFTRSAEHLLPGTGGEAGEAGHLPTPGSAFCVL